MPPPVESALSLFVGERPPDRPSRRPERMFLSELSNEEKRAVIDFLKRTEAEFSATFSPATARTELIGCSLPKGPPLDVSLQFSKSKKRSNSSAREKLKLLAPAIFALAA